MAGNKVKVSSGTSETVAGLSFAYVHEGDEHEDGDAKNGADSQNQVNHDVFQYQETESADSGPESSLGVFRMLVRFRSKVTKHSDAIWLVIKIILFLLYLAYTAYSLYRTWGTESATRLWLLAAIVLYVTGGRQVVRRVSKALSGVQFEEDTTRKALNFGRWALYVLAVAGAVVYLALEVAPYRPRNFVSLAGLAFLLFVGLLMSSHPDKIPWHTVFWGVALQFYLAVFVLRTKAGYTAVNWLGERVNEFVKYTDTGSRFLFGDAYTMHPFVFVSCPVIVFLSAAIAILYHFGLIQAIVSTLGRFLAVCLRTGPVESLNAAANIFFGLTEAPLFVGPYLDHVSQSELFAVMTGGFASISFTGIGIFTFFGIPANHLLTASVMSAPAALAVSKLIYPDSRKSRVKDEEVYKMVAVKTETKNLLEAVSEAAIAGVKVVVSLCANALMFLALLDFLDSTVEWFADQAGVKDLTFTKILSYLFYPLMFLCGVDSQDLLTLGRLVGVKIVANIIVAYQQAGVIIKNSDVFNDYVTTTNGTWRHVGDDVILDAWNTTLVGGVLTERSTVMVTYILCGLCHLSAFAVCLGVMTSLAPKRTSAITKLVVRAGIAGNIACFMTGCIAGLLFV